MRFCGMSYLIAAALLAIGANGAVNVTASRDYVDRKVSAATNGLAGKAEVDAKVNGLTGAISDLGANYNTIRETIGAHILDTNSPHKVTAEQAGAVPLVKDLNGKKTAVTIGRRKGGEYIGKYSLANGVNAAASGVSSHAEGMSTTASGKYSHAEGGSTTASGAFSHAAGYMAHTRSVDLYAFAWNGDDERTDTYASHGAGTYNINPVGGLDGFWIGEKTLAEILTNKANKAVQYSAGNFASLDSDGNLLDSGYNEKYFIERDLRDSSYISFPRGESVYFDGLDHTAGWEPVQGFYTRNGGMMLHGWGDYKIGFGSPQALPEYLASGDWNSSSDPFVKISEISATNTAFSNAVLAVGLSIDTNSVAVLNEIADSFGGFPIEGTATTVGGLLAALAAAIAWLKKNKVGSFASVGGASATVENGVAKLDDFFTESNSLLTGTIDEEVISKGTAPDAHLEAPTDEHLKLVLADNSVAYDSAKALPYKLTSVIGDRVIATMTLTAASTDITLPTITANDTTVKDFILDVTNAYAVEGVATDAGINIPRTDFKLVTRDGESFTAVTTVKAGKSAFICFTQKSPVVVDGTTYPCWCVIQLPFGDPS